MKQTKQDETTKRDQTVDSYNFIEYYWYLNNTGLTNLTNLILLIDMQDERTEGYIQKADYCRKRLTLSIVMTR